MPRDPPFALPRSHLNRSSLLGAQRIGGSNNNNSGANNYRNSFRLSDVPSSRVRPQYARRSLCVDVSTLNRNQGLLGPSCDTAKITESGMPTELGSPLIDLVGGQQDYIPFSSESPRKRGNDMGPESPSVGSTAASPFVRNGRTPPKSDIATSAWAAVLTAAAPLLLVDSADAAETAEAAAPHEAMENEAFLAEYMPRGQVFVMRLLSTWGDENEVGMNGVEIFDENGDRIVPYSSMHNNQENKGKGIEGGEEEEHTVPESINTSQLGETFSTLPEERRITAEGYMTHSYTEVHGAFHVHVEFPALHNEPATDSAYCCDAAELTDDGGASVRYCARNLVNTVYNTHDESKLFLMPYSMRGHHLIKFIFPQPIGISMVRVYNYSGCGRVHTTKGVRLLEMSVDDCIIFRGEIAQSTGDILPASRVGLDNCENILFTEDPQVLQRMMSMNSSAQETAAAAAAAELETETNASRSIAARTVLYCAEREDAPLRMGNTQYDTSTATSTADAESSIERKGNSPVGIAALPYICPVPEQTFHRQSSGDSYKCPTNVKSVCLMLLSTWGDTEHIGLSGLRFRNAQGDIVNHCISHWFIQFPSAGNDRESVDAFTKDLVYLFDENTSTALSLPFEYGMQIIFVFKTPLPTLGFVEVANFSLGEHTFCGVKDTRLLLSSPMDPLEPSEPNNLSVLIAAYATLWAPASHHVASVLPSRCGIFEVTPEEGVCLRKAPANLSIPRFQAYDLSLAAAFEVSVGGSHRRSLSASLGASMKIRLAMAMRRTQMALKPRPEWLLEYQPYLTPLLPVAYVLKVSLTLCATSVASLKSYAKEWMLKPSRSCTFADENGECISTRGDRGQSSGTKQRQSSSNSLCPDQSPDDSKKANGFVTEVLFTLLTSGYRSNTTADATTASTHTSALGPLLHAVVSLVYVADSPFCVSVVSLNRPLVASGRAAWVRHLRIAMDDALVFDSGDVGVPQPAPPQQHQQSSLHCAKEGPFRTLLRPLVFFTLDGAVLDEARREADKGW